ncbi:DUF4411 family protein [Priestia filamentosa]|uniref:hypothetical protein n=1 Tax=Priestia filamentosa TaxID=1402861 RepID=UPI00397C0F11
MEEINKIKNALKIYMIDTNVFRYRAYEIGNLKSEDEQKRDQHKRNAKEFFDKIASEAHANESLILLSEETKQELKVQAHTLIKESKTYNKIMRKLTEKNNTLVERTEVPLDLEYELRNFSNYIRKEYSGRLVKKGRQTNYLQTADTRIFLHAYLNDAIIVTANIKDFFFYPLFYNEGEDEVLYDISSRHYIKMQAGAKELLREDEVYKKLLEKMKKFKNGDS